MVAVMLTSSAWARLGETEAEARQRYGDPVYVSRETRTYRKNDIAIEATYFTSKSGTNVIGMIKYWFDSTAALDAGGERLLDANSEGQKWTKAGPDRPPTRKGAVLRVSVVENSVCFISDEYQAYIDKIAADKKAKENSKNKKATEGF